MKFDEVKKILYETYGHSASYKDNFVPFIRECEMIISKSKDRLDMFDITDVELLCLVLLERNAYEVLQNGLSMPIKNKFQKLWEYHMDSLLSKAPICYKKIIYRNDQYCNIEYLKKLYKEGKPYKVNHYFTCSKEFIPLGGCSIKFIIHPLRQESRAHNVYMLYNFGRNRKDAKPEWQIEYERLTEFNITSINQKGGYYVVHLHELKRGSNKE